jgi:hypothetical protein
MENILLDQQGSSQSGNDAVAGNFVAFCVDEVYLTNVYAQNSRDCGISITNCNKTRITSCVIDTVITGGAGNGINIVGSTPITNANLWGDAVITGCLVFGVPDKSIYCASVDVARTSITNCIVRGGGTGNDGICLEVASTPSSDSTLTGNVVEGMANSGMGLINTSGSSVLYGSRALISSNVIRNCLTGIILQDRLALVTGNVITDVNSGVAFGTNRDYDESEFQVVGNLITMRPGATGYGITGTKSVGAGTKFLRRFLIANNVILGEAAPPVCVPVYSSSVAGSVNSGSHVYQNSFYTAVVSTTGTVSGAPSPTLTVASAAGLKVGQSITIVGAGAAGADFTTTIKAIAGTTITLAANASTNVAGAAVTAYTETLASPISAAITAADGAHSVTVGAIPLGPQGTIGRILYRSPAGSTTCTRLAVIADNTSTTYSDTASDASIASGGAPLTRSTIVSVDGINLTSRCKDGDIRGNLVAYFGQNGVCLVNASGAAPTEIAIDGNRIIDCGLTASSGNQNWVFVQTNADQVRVTNNRMLYTGTDINSIGLNVQTTVTNMYIDSNTLTGFSGGNYYNIAANVTGYLNQPGVYAISESTTPTPNFGKGNVGVFTITANTVKTFQNPIGIGSCAGYHELIIVNNSGGVTERANACHVPPSRIATRTHAATDHRPPAAPDRGADRTSHVPRRPPLACRQRRP